ncbi:MAG: peptidoglycan-binding protein [Micropruina sp.]|uniref:peptidoglycan-binding protein n=1 Tax=Micropruina sp. TaxID=2737536 RepID=UPI0039E2CC2D
MTLVPVPGGKLRSDAAASYGRMLAAGMPAGGIDVYSRTMAQQQALYDAYRAGRGPVAAKPSRTAPHIMGVAMDAHTTTGGKYAPSGAHSWLAQGTDGGKSPREIGRAEYCRANDYGWRRTVPSERWHWQYDSARDKARALRVGSTAKFAVADAQRLLGVTADGVFGSKTEAAVEAAQRAAGFPASAVDGVIGAKTWPILKPQPAPTERGLRLVQVNTLAQRWNTNTAGVPDDAPAWPAWLAKQKPSLMLLCETSGERIAALARSTPFRPWERIATGYVSLWWDARLWAKRGQAQVNVRTTYHGAVRATLADLKGSDLELDVVSLHVPPNASYPAGWSDAEKVEGKLGDLRAILKAVARPTVPTIVGGDFNTALHDSVMEQLGFRRLTEAVDTLRGGATGKLDAVWFRGSIRPTESTLLDPGTLSDHYGWMVRAIRKN